MLVAGIVVRGVRWVPPRGRLGDRCGAARDSPEIGSTATVAAWIHLKGEAECLPGQTVRGRVLRGRQGLVDGVDDRLPWQSPGGRGLAWLGQRPDVLAVHEAYAGRSQRVDVSRPGRVTRVSGIDSGKYHHRFDGDALAKNRQRLV